MLFFGRSVHLVDVFCGIKIDCFCERPNQKNWSRNNLSVIWQICWQIKLACLVFIWPPQPHSTCISNTSCGCAAKKLCRWEWHKGLGWQVAVFSIGIIFYWYHQHHNSETSSYSCQIDWDYKIQVKGCCFFCQLQADKKTNRISSDKLTRAMGRKRQVLYGNSDCLMK